MLSIKNIKFRLFILLFIILNTFSINNIYASLYFSPTNSTLNPTNIINKTNENIKIDKTNEQLKPNFEFNETNSYLKMHDNIVIDKENITVSDYIPENPYMSNPFRYTEVTFIITAAFAFAYSTLATSSVYNLQNSFILKLPERGAYKTIGISTTVFQIFSGLSVASAVAYDSYQRIYGKNKKGKQLSFNFTPFYDPPNKEAGFVFSLSYELGNKKNFK